MEVKASESIDNKREEARTGEVNALKVIITSVYGRQYYDLMTFGAITARHACIRMAHRLHYHLQ